MDSSIVGGDTESLSLTETGSSTGIFRSLSGLSLLYAPQSSAHNDMLEVSGSGSAQVTYTDIFDTSDNPVSSVFLRYVSEGGGGAVSSVSVPSPYPTVWQSSAHACEKDFQGNIKNSLYKNDAYQRLEAVGLEARDLVKLRDQEKAAAQEDIAVYYIGADGKRHAFPSVDVYLSWYPDFSGVHIVNVSDLASIPLGANITYKPGSKLVKFISDPKVYAVDRGGVLRWVKNGELAERLYRASWKGSIVNISDALYVNYHFGLEISRETDYRLEEIMASCRYPDGN